MTVFTELCQFLHHVVTKMCVLKTEAKFNISCLQWLNLGLQHHEQSDTGIIFEVLNTTKAAVYCYNYTTTFLNFNDLWHYTEWCGRVVSKATILGMFWLFPVSNLGQETAILIEIIGNLSQVSTSNQITAASFNIPYYSLFLNHLNLRRYIPGSSLNK
jgi:hypothetical protein